MLTFRALPFDPRIGLAPFNEVGAVSPVPTVSPALGFGTVAPGSTTRFFGPSIAGTYGSPPEPVACRGAAPLASDLVRPSRLKSLTKAEPM